MKCFQCNKPVDHPCDRPDCLAEQSIAAQHRLAARADKQKQDGFDNVRNLRENFDKVSEWAERNGWTKPADRQRIYAGARETFQAAAVYAAIARSL